MTEDTFLGTKDNTLTLNRYIYGNGNPLKYKDPSGNYIDLIFYQYEPQIEEIFNQAWIWISGAALALGAYFTVKETIKEHNIEVFPKAYNPSNTIIDVPSSDIPTTNVDIYPRVETPSPNILVTPTENVIGNNIVGDIIIAEENSAQIVCDKETIEHKNNVGEYLDKRTELTGTTKEKLLQQVGDTDLRKEINELYRDKAVIGDGGTADALKEEFENGSSKHLQKAIERLNNLNKIISKNNLNLEDLDIAEALRDDLESAINLFQ